MNHSARECSRSVITKSELFYLLKSQFLRMKALFPCLPLTYQWMRRAAPCAMLERIWYGLYRRRLRNESQSSWRRCFLHYTLFKDRKQCDQSDTTDDSDNLDWVKVLDRGHCHMKFIKFPCVMETVVNGEMILRNKAAMKAGFKEKLAFEVHQDEDVLFWWSNLCDVTNVVSECSKSLASTLHYVVIQGFARWMEVFIKEGSKKNRCGTKSLRINCRLQLFLSVHINISTPMCNFCHYIHVSASHIRLLQ